MSTFELVRSDTLISDAYRILNRDLHASRPDYGTSGAKYAPVIQQLAELHKTWDVLDYGAGKRTLETALQRQIANYDPCVAGLEEPPQPHDIVACTDVLEHIEPGCLSAVLADLRRVTRVVCFMTIATRPAKKYLADGRNAHLIQRQGKWWIERLWDAEFRLRQYADMDLELQVIVQ